MIFSRLLFSAGLALSTALAVPAAAQPQDLHASFDAQFGTDMRRPQSFEAVYDSALEQRIARLADGTRGRIGVAALDLATGNEIAVLGDQRFPMASTSKIAIAATFMEGVEQGRWTLTSEFPLLWPLNSARFSSQVAPVKAGKHLPARELMELMITRSSNPATDALLAVVGGPSAVNAWMARKGIGAFSLDRDIATLVRDDGEFDPATHIDLRDSASPRAMVKLLAGLRTNNLLTTRSSDVILSTMGRTRTGARRIPAGTPDSAFVRHKTGSLNNTSSDIGIIRMPDGRDVALAIYVTGQGSRLAREAKIAEIARALYDGYAARPAPRQWTGAEYGGQ